ncbi:MAG: branched-chain amino acid ABC transporter permease [Acidimicrobiia bacterium]
MDLVGIFGDSLRYGVGEFTMVFALAALGVNLQFGYCGLLNFGQAGFAAAGAYGVAVAVGHFGWSFALGVSTSLLAAVVLGLLLGFPTLRLRGDYLAIVTIAASEIIRFVLQASNFRGVTGGADGLQGFAGTFRDLNPIPPGRHGFWRLEFSSSVLWVMLVGWLLVAAFAVLTHLLIESPWGRVVKGIREDEDAVRSLGKNVYAYKMQVLVLGGAMGAVAGLMDGLARGSATPANYQPGFTFFAYVMVILGGTAKVWAPIVGAIVFNTLLQFSDLFLRAANDSFVPSWLVGDDDVGAVRFVLMGGALMALMVFRPQGIFGDRREVAIGARR